VTIDVPASGKVLVLLTANVLHNANCQSAMGFESTGGSGNVGPDFTRAISLSGNLTLSDLTQSGAFMVSGLSPGSHTFTAKYAQPTGPLRSAFYSWRHITVIPLP